jgi:hypothetical protein
VVAYWSRSKAIVNKIEEVVMRLLIIICVILLCCERETNIRGKVVEIVSEKDTSISICQEDTLAVYLKSGIFDVWFCKNCSSLFKQTDTQIASVDTGTRTDIWLLRPRSIGVDSLNFKKVYINLDKNDLLKEFIINVIVN